MFAPFVIEVTHIFFSFVLLKTHHLFGHEKYVCVYACVYAAFGYIFVTR